ncbi:DUF6263 family protein [Saccharicrinis sp. FJH54]|uniref:DUF6263 family protein n=1 Tax=Saccharicrinis sp. FJH54 TaxID=3344665 RepID=UPI0035D52789
MNNLVKPIILFILLFLTGPLSAKKYNLEYKFKPGTEVLYHLEIKNDNTYVFQGIGEKNKIVLTFDLNVKVYDKTKNGDYLLHISVPDLVCEFFSREQSVSRINSSDNTADAAMLRRMINQDIIIEISPKGAVKIIKGLEEFIGTMDISHSMKGALLSTFSRQGFSEITHYLFPEYPEIKVRIDESWQTKSKKFGTKKQTISTNYILTETGETLKIKSADYIENQKTQLKISDTEVSCNLMGSSDNTFETDADSGWVRRTTSETKQISEDKTIELITNLKISR